MKGPETGFFLLYLGTHKYIHMFILREIQKSGRVTNQSLGDRYEVIWRENNPDDFNSINTKEKTGELCYAFVSYKESYYPLFSTMTYYVMTESGKTFDNLTKSLV